MKLINLVVTTITRNYVSIFSQALLVNKIVFIIFHFYLKQFYTWLNKDLNKLDASDAFKRNKQLSPTLLLRPFASSCIE